MPRYRITIRYGETRTQYHVDDREASSLPDLLHDLADSVPAAAADSADLVEIRVQADPDEREYTPG